MPALVPSPVRLALEGARQGGLRRGDTVVVGASGGADSTALACLLAGLGEHGLPLSLVLVHVDHGWRGPEAAAADWAFVEALARRLGLAAHRSAPPPAGTPQTEDAARRHRYVGFARAARAAGAKRVAVAHHVGDQAETLVMRVLRGSGAYGLAGIPARRRLGEDLEIVRPLLRAHPDALRAWLRERGVAWREDPTNRDTSRARAQVRARLRRRAARHADPRAWLAAIADRLRRRVSARESRIERTIAAYVHDYPFAGAVRVSRARLRALDTRLDLELALRTMGRRLHASRHGPWLTRRVLDAVARVLDRGGAVDLPRGLRVHVAGGKAWLVWRTQPELSIPVPKVDVVVLADESFSRASRNALLDADRLGEDVGFRYVTPEDTFVPFGSRSGREVNVVRWLSKQGVPAFARRGVLVLQGRTGIAWVVGERIDARHAITVHTQRGVVVSFPLAPGAKEGDRATPSLG